MAKHMVKKEFRDDESKKESYEQLKVIQSKSVDEMNSYDDDFKYKPHEGNNPLEVRTIPDLVRFLKANEGASIDAKFFVYNKKRASFLMKLTLLLYSPPSMFILPYNSNQFSQVPKRYC